MLLPPGLKTRAQIGDHRGSDVGVDPPDAAKLVAEPLVLDDLQHPVLDQPRLVPHQRALPPRARQPRTVERPPRTRRRLLSPIDRAGRAPSAAIAATSAHENRRCVPTEEHGSRRSPAQRRSHDSRTCNNPAACAGVNNNTPPTPPEPRRSGPPIPTTTRGRAAPSTVTRRPTRRFHPEVPFSEQPIHDFSELRKNRPQGTPTAQERQE